MTKHDKIAATVFLLVAAMLFAVALRPQLRSHISDFALFVMLGAALGAAGIYHIATARCRAERFSRQLRDASAIRRLWLPARFYTSTALQWQLRLGGIMALCGAAIVVFAAFLAYGRGW